MVDCRISISATEADSERVTASCGFGLRDSRRCGRNGDVVDFANGSIDSTGDNAPALDV